jgi:BirA family biotin operon repressor/biotin-[acetyl-CoA-carboxylase] ligase
LYKIPEGTLFVGKNLVVLSICNSTNTAAAEWSDKPGVAEGTVVISHDQEAGRGQRGNSWESEPGKNLTLSIILYPKISPTDFFNLNLAISLGVYDTLATLCPDRLAVKWPNDIILNNRKVCGILIENTITAGLIARSIAGIGLNVNQEQFQFNTASSLQKETGRAYDLNQLLAALLHAVEIRYMQSKTAPLELRTDYLNAMYWRHEPHRFSANGKVFEGSIEGIDENGKLQVGVGVEICSFGLKEITYLD